MNTKCNMSDSDAEEAELLYNKLFTISGYFATANGIPTDRAVIRSEDFWSILFDHIENRDTKKAAMEKARVANNEELQQIFGYY